MRPTDHVQMVTSWCELTLCCVDRVGIREMPGKTVWHSRYLYTAITSTSDHERGDDSWWPIACTGIDIYISTFYPQLSDNIRLRQTVADWRTRYKVSTKLLGVQPPSIPFCYPPTIYDLAVIVLVLEQGYLYVLLAACPLIFFCCHYITRVCSL